MLPPAPGGPTESSAATRLVEPTPFPLPSGASGLALQTAPPGGPVAGVPQLCTMTALANALRVSVVDSRVAFVDIRTGAEIHLAWPRGFSARLVAGRAEIVGPDGDVIARNGSLLVGLNGDPDASGAFVLCPVTGYVGPFQAPSSPRPSPGPNAPQIR